MPFFFTCEQCQAAVKPLPDNCYVFGSYGSVPYPSQQVWRPSVCHADASVGTVHRHHAPEWQNILRIRVPEILPKDKHRVWVVHLSGTLDCISLFITKLGAQIFSEWIIPTPSLRFGDNNGRELGEQSAFAHIA
jgi:hypothetical protein